MISIDINCDLGEGGCDEQLMPLITSANIACGGHAGDDGSMRQAVQLALAHGVNIGAHPGFLDRENFGRTELQLEPAEIRRIVSMQVDRLAKIAAVQGAALRHVKPHGALYNIAARDEVVAGVIVQAIADIDTKFLVVGLAGGALVRVAQERNLVAVKEIFADRRYRPDGSLVPRGQPGALIEDVALAAEQVVQMVRRATAAGGSTSADTVCIHGDGHAAHQMLSALRARLAADGIAVRKF